MDIKEIKIIKMSDGDTGEYDTYFIIKGEDFEKAKELCKEAEEKYYEDDYSCSLYETVLELFDENNIEYSNFSCCDVDYEF